MAKNHAHFLPLLGIFAALFWACGGQPTAPEKSVQAPPVPADFYTEKHRPQFHFSPAAKWMNDPNGMFFYEGEYHFFYQYYPDSTVWGPMHWAHAVSRDLVRWEHLPVALYPDSVGYIFSGSAVVDWKNTSGFGQNGQPPLVAVFTYHNMEKELAKRQDVESQAIAYSTDRGRTWTKYPANPVLPNPGDRRDFRDPKVCWHEASGQWVMTLAVKDHIEFWGSKDLKSWTKHSEFGQKFGAHGGVWECPDLFPLPVEGTGDTRWVLLVSINPGAPNGGSATQYFVGDFDGKNFTLDPAFAPAVTGKDHAAWMDFGKDNYAGVTWSDVPQADGRRILVGWMSNWQYATVVPTEQWRSAATLPRTLHLKKTGTGGYLLLSKPVRELEKLRGKSSDLAATDLAGPVSLAEKLGFAPRLAELELEFELPEKHTGSFGVELANGKNERYRIGYDAAKNQFFSDRTRAGDVSFSKDFAGRPSVAPRFSNDRTVRLHLFFDAASAELFADGGEVAMTEVFFPSEDFSNMSLFAEEGGGVRLVLGKIWELNSIWR